MSTLYELTGQRLALAKRLEELDMDSETIADTLEGESTELEAKIADYGYVIRNRRSFEHEITAEIERLTARRDAERARVNKIEEWLLTNMQACGITQIECPAFTVKVQHNPESVDIFDQSAVPFEYLRVPEPKPPIAAPDKVAIKAALKAGQEVAGCALKRSVKLIIK